MKETTVSLAQAVTASEAVLPVRVQEALGELVDSAKEGLLALSVGVGLGVLAELMEEEVVDVVGPRSKPDPARSAYRHGHEPARSRSVDVSCRSSALVFGAWTAAARSSSPPTATSPTATP